MKGFVITLSLMSFIIMIVIGVIISIVVGGMHLFHLHITKTFIIETIFVPVSTQDALLSLMEFEDNGIKFKHALVYGIYENTFVPKVYFDDSVHEYDLTLASKNYLSYVYDKYWLFFYNSSSHEYKTITSSENNPEKIFEETKNNKRASFPIGEDYWLVLYSK